jgi:hypothetical protein
MDIGNRRLVGMIAFGVVFGAVIVILYGCRICSVSLDLHTLVDIWIFVLSKILSGGSRDRVDHIPNQECSAQGDTSGARIVLTLMVARLSKKSPSAGCLSYFIFHLYWVAAVNSTAKGPSN